MKEQTLIIKAYYSNETTGKMLWTQKEVRKALKKNNEVRAIITTTEGRRRRTSPIIAVKKGQIETVNSFYILEN